MRGNGRGKTAIVWSQSSEDNIDSATFKVEAHDFIAFGISFKVNSLYILKTLQPYAGKEGWKLKKIYHEQIFCNKI